MNRREIIMALIDTTEIKPELISLMGSKVHTTEDLKSIIRNILTYSIDERRENILHHNFTFGSMVPQDK